MGRRKHTGHYQTREELESRLWGYYFCVGVTAAAAARMCGISEGVAHNILNKKIPKELHGIKKEYRRIGTRNVMVEVNGTS